MYWPFGPVWSWYTGPSGQFGPDLLALRASFVLIYWPFGPVSSWYTGPSGQFCPYVLALWASLVLSYWSSLVLMFPGPLFTLNPVKTVFLLHRNTENRRCSIFETSKTASYQIWHQIRIPRPSFTLKHVKTSFLLHGNAKNRRCSIFGTSKNGVIPNLTPNSDSPSFIYPKTGQNRFFIT